MRKNTGLLRLSSGLMLLNGLAYAAQITAAVIRQTPELFLENQAAALAAVLTAVQAVLEILCAWGGLQAVLERKSIHGYVHLGTAVLVLAIVTGVLSPALRTSYWFALAWAVLELAVPALYLGAAVANDCTGGKWFPRIKERRRRLPGKPEPGKFLRKDR